MTGHFVVVLKGWITFRFAGVEGDVTVKAGACLSQPAGVAHNVIARSDDLELIEINMPAEYGTKDLGGPLDAAQPREHRAEPPRPTPRREPRRVAASAARRR